MISIPNPTNKTPQVYQIPTGAKTFQQNGKYTMPWTVKELNVAVKNYLRLGGFDIVKSPIKFQKFYDELHAINSKRSETSIEMIIFNIARCDKNVMYSGSLSLWGGTGKLMIKVLQKMDPNEVRFAHTSLRTSKV